MRHVVDQWIHFTRKISGIEVEMSRRRKQIDQGKPKRYSCKNESILRVCSPHDRERCHVKRDPGPSLQLLLVQLASASHNVARSVCGFHDEFVLCQLFQNLTWNGRFLRALSYDTGHSVVMVDSGVKCSFANTHRQSVQPIEEPSDRSPTCRIVLSAPSAVLAFP